MRKESTKSSNKMKSPKSKSTFTRIRYNSIDQHKKSPKKSAELGTTNDISSKNPQDKTRSRSWKCMSMVQQMTAGRELVQAPSTSNKTNADILYSDVLFNGDHPKSRVKMTKLTPRQKRVQRKCSKPRLKSTNAKTHSNLENQKKPDTLPSEIPTLKYTDVIKFVKDLSLQMNVNIPSWNLTDLDGLDNYPKFDSQYDDYNYLACENAALVGLRLASDGKFKF